MEVTALYVNLTDLFSERLLEEAVRYAMELRAAYGIEVVSACNYDVNGFGWALPSILRRAGVRYLDTAINETRALGVRPRPAPYRWAAPNGDDVLLWHSRGYLLGNDLLLHASATWAAPQVAQFLSRVRRDGYPHWGMQALISGHKGDSMPPTATVCDVVEEWNRTWRWPKLRIATVREWFGHLEQHWPQPLVRQQRAWPDWWADGNGAALFEAALARATQARLGDLEAQRDVLRQAGIALQRLDEQYAAAWRRTMLFCEHTWGPYETALAPYGTAARGQWHSKASHAYAAAALADSIEAEQMVALATMGAQSARTAGLTNATLQGVEGDDLALDHPPAVLVFNPLPQLRSDLVRVHVPGHLGGRAPQLRDARTGELVAVQVRFYPPEDVVNAAHLQVEFLAADLAPHSHYIFWIEPGAEGSTPSPATGGATWMENAYARVQVDPHTGAITSILHSASGRELVQQGGVYALNQCVCERVASPEGRNAIASWRGRGSDAHFNRSTPGATSIVYDEARPGARSLIVHATGEYGIRLRTEIVLYEHAERVDIINTLDKPATTEAEAIYHAFPLAAPHAQIYLALAGGVIRPGTDQVPGSATDWHGIQDWFAAATDDFAVIVASPDVSLVQCTGINTGRWLPELPPSNGLVMSWALNNYWFTNFPASQGGQVTYRYSITLQEGAFNIARAASFAAQVRHRTWGRAVQISPTLVRRSGGIE